MNTTNVSSSAATSNVVIRPSTTVSSSSTVIDLTSATATVVDLTSATVHPTSATVIDLTDSQESVPLPTACATITSTHPPLMNIINPVPIVLINQETSLVSNTTTSPRSIEILEKEANEEEEK